MGLVELLLGVVFAAGLATGIGLGAMDDAGNLEFWTARLGFVVAAGTVAVAYWYWWHETERPVAHVIAFGVIAGFWVFVALPLQLKWVAIREEKNRLLEQAAKPKPAETTTERPDVTLSFANPPFPTVLLTNQSSQTLKDIKYSVYLWNIDDPRTYNNPHSAEHPEMHDPLVIPTATFDFLRPHQSSNQQDIFATSLVLPYLKKGNRLIGTASVDCPDCDEGHTYIVGITWGEGGWYYEIKEVNGEKLKGRTLIPEHPSKEAVQIYYAKILSLAPEADRIPIK
jgi:hypothetical protein